jgi:NitT/TauT family transport system substrate-binding protein
MKTLTLESTAPFQGLPELVAYAEGLFAKEGIDVKWADRATLEKPKEKIDADSPKGLDPFSSHGILFEQGAADMYNACEWGNMCRVQDTRVGSRQIGRRGIITFAAIVVRGDSPYYTPQQLAGKTVGVPFYFGSHYMALHLLEGFMPREDIKLVSLAHGSNYRLQMLAKGEVEATTLTEPYVSLAEKMGYRTVCSGLYHGTEVASNKVDADTYAAFNRAVREAVRRINADKSKYLHYFIDYHKAENPELARMKPEEIPVGLLVVCDPAPIPAEEAQRTYEWLRGWGMLEQTETPAALVNAEVQQRAHAAAH